MILCATLTLSLALPQLHVEPYRSEVGQEVVVRAEKDGGMLAGTEIIVQFPDGSRRSIGVTDAGGVLRFTASEPGDHVARAAVGDLRLLAPFHIVSARSRWWAAAVCVPLGLALLWRSLRGGQRQRAR